MSETPASEPSQNEVETARFNGQMIGEWRAIDLRGILSLLDPGGGSRRMVVKANLCRDLFRIKDRSLTVQEQRAIREFQTTRSIRAGRAILRGDTFVKREITPSSDSNIKTEAGDQNGTKPDSPNGKPNYDVQRCETCFEDLGLHHFPKMTNTASCKHESFLTCIDCLSAHIEVQAATISLTEIPCPEAGCKEHLSYEQMQAYAPAPVFSRYNNYSNTKAISDLPDYYKCANRYCLSGGFVDVKYANWFTCTDCQARTCIACNTLWHPDVGCAGNQVKVKKEDEEETKRFEEELRRLEEEEERKIAEVRAEAALKERKDGEEQKTSENISKVSKKCPRCDVRIEKNGGCDHMKCKQCKYDFCWVCMADYNSIRKDGNQMHTLDCAYYRPVTDPEQDAIDTLVAELGD